MKGRHRIIHGDCIDVLRRMPSESVDAIVTDPPYGIGYQSGFAPAAKVANDEAPFIWWLAEAFRVLRSPGAMVCFCRWDTEGEFRMAMRCARFRPRGQIVWDRETHGSGDVYADVGPRHDNAVLATKGRWRFAGPRLVSVLRAPRVAWQNRAHPTQKPVSVLTTIIESLTAPNDIVLDPFLGSGSTAVAALEAGRRVVGIELDAGHVATARARVAQCVRGGVTTASQAA